MKNLIYLLLITISICSCNNDDDSTSSNPIDQLPPPTQTGENTFGYLVNGEPIIVNNTMKITAIYQQNQLQLGGGVENDKIDIDIQIFVGGPLEEGISYNLTNVARYMDFKIWETCQYNMEDTYKGRITFTNVDTENFIISGVFSFSTVTDNCEDINITDGRFDVHYIP